MLPRLLLATLVLVLAVPSTATAASIVVRDAGNEGDADHGDGVCATQAGTCTLRAAIQTANHEETADTITFSLPAEARRARSCFELDACVIFVWCGCA